MNFVYSIIAYIVALLSIPVLAVISLFSDKVRTGLGQRFGWHDPIPLARQGAKRVWLHCASVGEVQTAESLIELLLADERIDLVLSTMTPTGQAVAEDKYADRMPVFFWPLEIPWTVNRVLDLVAPDLLLILETELWPAVLDRAKRRDVPVAILNARISDKTFRNYRRLGFFLKPILQSIKVFSVQNESYANRLLELGACKDAVKITGNLKFSSNLDGAALLSAPSVVDEIWPRGTELFTAASTHDGEDGPAIDAYLEAVKTRPGLRLVLAPRHVERGDAVAELLKKKGLSLVRRTQMDENPVGEPEAFLLDTVGELAGVLARSRACFVGGSLIPVGGHNILEPAALGVPVLFGPHMANFRDAADVVSATDAGLCVTNARELARQLTELLNNPVKWERMSRAGREVVEQNRGAASKNRDVVFSLLGLS